MIRDPAFWILAGFTLLCLGVHGSAALGCNLASAGIAIMMDHDNFKEYWLQERAIEKAAKIAAKEAARKAKPKNIFRVMFEALTY